jgi:hypothetical protein
MILENPERGKNLGTCPAPLKQKSQDTGIFLRLESWMNSGYSLDLWIFLGSQNQTTAGSVDVHPVDES